MPHSSDKDLIPKDKNSVTIRLTESAVFLRSDSSTHHRIHTEEQPSVLRGLLILNLAKPTKISRIDVELMGKTEMAWPEGIGARRAEFSEEHCFFRASTSYFEAGKAHSRRTASIGPGVAYTPEYGSSHEDWEELHSNIIRRRHHERNSTSSEGPSLHLRNASVDNGYYQSHHISHYEEQMHRVPPYSPHPTSPYSRSPSVSSPGPGSGHSPIPSPSHLDPGISSAQDLEDFGSRRSISTSHYLLNPPISASTSQSPSIQYSHSPRLDYPVSRQPSIGDILEHEPDRAGYSQNARQNPYTPRQISSYPEDRDRGRRNGRFTFAAVSNAFMDVVRSGSPIITRSRERSRDDVGSVARGRTMGKKLVEDITAPQSPLHKDHEVEGSTSRAKQAKDNFLDKVGEILRLDVTEHKENGKLWKEFKKGVYTYPISFQIPGDSPPSIFCDYGAATWSLRAHVHRPGTFSPKYTAEREVVVVSCPTEDDTEEGLNIIIERHWDHQLQYLIAISGRSFYIGGTLPITFTMLPLTKAKVYRIAVYLEERVDYYTKANKIARTDPINCCELICIRNQGKNAAPILPLGSDDPEAYQKSPFFEHLAPKPEDEDEMSEMASSFMGPGPWAFHLDVKLPRSCTRLKPTNKNKRAGMVVHHLLKIVMRMERGDNDYMNKDGGKKLFDIVVQTPVHILSNGVRQCRCDPEWISLPRYSESVNPVERVVQNCPCHVQMFPRTPPEILAPGMFRPHPTLATLGGLERTSSRNSTDSSASHAEDHSINPALMPSLHRPIPNRLFIANTLFERLVSGQESEIGEMPPAYEPTSPRSESRVDAN
ncbi:hypothetical protein P691DRAFT_699236 [Macrolepiota fuliginosa MF-IS2]|uniref:Arrestin C-terminal-like domain-containing protein n=1 Tax=Macrolepiota fuliginosa MF-IS2 TaxID=1400762 RepID=A0A9P5XHL8_9AGAR|nr:hypothetical protein P691DRAFT_699236 [Macrolepiota fuliginosa MF-IS2]